MGTCKNQPELAQWEEVPIIVDGNQDNMDYGNTIGLMI